MNLFKKSIFIILLFFSQIAFSEKPNDQVDTLILLVVDTIVRGDLDGLNHFPGKKFLVIHQHKYNLLTEIQKYRFDEIDVFQNIDYQEIKKHVSRFVTNPKKTCIAAIGDGGVGAGAQLRLEMGIPGSKPEDVIQFRDKQIAKSLLAKNNIRIPKFMNINKSDFEKDANKYVSEIEATIESYPMFAKPSNGTSSRGIMKINSNEDLQLFLKKLDKKEYYEINEFLTGTLFEIDALVRNNEIIYIVAAENLNPYHEFQEGKSTGAITIPLNDPNFIKFYNYANDIKNALGPVPNGVLNIEFFINNNNEFVFVEAQARRPGNLFTQIYKIHSGFDLEAISIMLQAGMDIKLPNDNNNKFAAWIEIPHVYGTVESKNAPPLTKSVVQIQYRVHEGTLLQKATSNREVAASMLMENSNYEQLREDFFKLGRTFVPLNIKHIL